MRSLIVTDVAIIHRVEVAVFVQSDRHSPMVGQALRCAQSAQEGSYSGALTQAAACAVGDQSTASVNSGFQVVDCPKIPELPYQVAKLR